MNRVGILLIMLSLTLVLFSGCDEETTSVYQTGIEIRCAGCLPFGVYVFVDNEPVGQVSSEEPGFFELPSGTYRLYAYSNAESSTTNQYYCWTIESVTVSEGNVTGVVLPCVDEALCE
jgi:hypothetical protein